MLNDIQTFQEAAKKLGKRQKIILRYVYPAPRTIQLIPLIKSTVLGLAGRGLLYVNGNRVSITAVGKTVVETNSLHLPDSTLDSFDDLLNSLRLPNKVETSDSKPRKLGRWQKIVLESVYSSPVKIESSLMNPVISNLKLKGLIEISNDQMSITELGRIALLASRPTNLDEQQGINESSLSPSSNTASLFDVLPRKLGKKQAMLLQFLDNAPRLLKQIRKAKGLMPHLQGRGLIEINGNEVSITPIGKYLVASFKRETGEVFDNEELQSLFISSNKIQSQKRLHKKSEEFLSLYRQGLTYQAIGDLHGMTRERVRQILNKNPAFHDYLKEYEEQKIIAGQEKEALATQILLSKSLAALYPERVAELWDYEKNGDLSPKSISATSTLHYIWLKCPADGHSWKKKAYDISQYSWGRVGTSGCPACAGRTRESKKQPTLAEVYMELVVDYWDFEKNLSLGLDPEILTLGSNRKAWFKCPQDGNEWESSIAATVNQQWSQGNAGCKVCNGTDKRKIGKWGEANPIAIEFPDEVAKYWLYTKNDELKLDPSKIKTGSAREAWFKCLVDGLEWKAKISAVKSSWSRGNSGCPACRGLVTTNSTSLLALYPEFVGEFWDYEKNSEVDLDPNNLTKGTKHPNKISLGYHLAESYFVFQTDVVEDCLYLPFELGE